jgi:hypothetical protein
MIFEQSTSVRKSRDLRISNEGTIAARRALDQADPLMSGKTRVLKLMRQVLLGFATKSHAGSLSRQMQLKLERSTRV